MDMYRETESFKKKSHAAISDTYSLNSYVKEIHFSVIFLAKKFVLSMIIRIFAASVLAKPLNNAQIVRGVFCLYTFEYGESYSLYKTV